VKEELENLRELVSEVTAEIEGTRTAETFLINEKLVLLKDQLDKGEQFGIGLKKKLKLKDLIAKKLTKKLEAFRVSIMGEDSVKKEGESSDNENEESVSSENGIAIPLERLSTEVNKIMTSGKSLSSFYKSFNSGNSLSKKSLDKSSSEYYSENSGLQEDSSDSISGAKSEKLFQLNSDEDTSRTVKWTPNDITNACQICSEPFTWYRWKHHCRKCGKYFINYNIDWYVTIVVRIKKDTEKKSNEYATIVQKGR
jgi:hypothetical protein